MKTMNAYMIHQVNIQSCNQYGFAGYFNGFNLCSDNPASLLNGMP
ncbi:MAG: hypothetical protein N2484_11530 [Clostridia bacterium]|nr:hypothetical protein [Clostridia bacterium]